MKLGVQSKAINKKLLEGQNMDKGHRHESSVQMQDTGI